MTNTILVTGSTSTAGNEVVVRQFLQKYINFLKSVAISKVTLTFEETTESKPITLRKFAESYAEELK